MSDGVRELCLLRHAESAAPESHAVGQWDLPLSPRGIATLADFVQNWEGPPPDRIVSSDLQRTRHTATAIAARFGLPVSLDPDWREVSLGEWEQRTWADLEREDGERLAAWYAQWRDLAPPGGEDWKQVRARVQRAVARLVDSTGARERVLVVTHVGAIRAFLSQVDGLDDERAFAFPLPPLGGVMARCIDASGEAPSWHCEPLAGSDPGFVAARGRAHRPEA